MGLFGKKKTDDDVAAEIMKKREKEKATQAAAASDADMKAKAAAAMKTAGVVTESKVTALVAEMKANAAEAGELGSCAERLRLLADLCSSKDADKCAARAVKEGGLPAVVATMGPILVALAVEVTSAVVLALERGAEIFCRSKSI